jgi:hypothetical protein
LILEIYQSSTKVRELLYLTCCVDQYTLLVLSFLPDCIRRLASNAYVKRFVSGKTRQHVQFKEELVTEMIFQTSHDLHSPNDPIDQWRSGHLWGIDKEKAALRWQTRQIVASLLDLNGSWESTGSTSNKKYHPDPPSSQNPTYSVNKNRPSAAKASLSLRQQDPPTKLQA